MENCQPIKSLEEEEEEKEEEEKEEEEKEEEEEKKEEEEEKEEEKKKKKKASYARRPEIFSNTAVRNHKISHSTSDVSTAVLLKMQIS
jgi:hypothetical protein